MGHRERHLSSLVEFMNDAPLSQGQRRRLGLLHSVEGEVCERVGRICVTDAIDVADVAVLVVAMSAYAIVFGADEEGPANLRERTPPSGSDSPATILAGHREQLHAFLSHVLPPAPEANVDPYIDLKEPAPPRCARVLVVDEESLTILSYGSFVLVRLNAEGMPRA